MKVVSVLPILVLGYLIVLTSSGWAQLPLVNIETVLIGDLGNASDTTGHGAVAHEYEIGKYEVTIGQYVTFLNSVAAVTTTATTNSNPHLLNLWHTSMAGSSHSSGISRSGSGTVSDPYVYAPIGSDRQPIYSVSWFDAARFCNWVHNGATNGADTETGAYTLNEAISGLISKNPNAKWWIPTEDEWYKAAYYEGATLQNYWLYPTRSNDEPGNVEGGDTNQASYGKNTLSDVGAYTGSSSFYGTFDQAGNVWEWTDSLNPGPRYPDGRTVRGGAYDNPSFALKSSWVSADAVGNEWTYLGFRVATIDPSSDLDNDGVTYYRETTDGTNPNDATSFNPLSKGLVAYYPLDGNANDESGYGNNGAILGSITEATDRLNVAAKAYQFQGAGSISIPHTSRLSLTESNSLTVTAWIFRTQSSIEGDGHVMGKRPQGSHAFNWQVSYTSTYQDGTSFISGTAVGSLVGARSGINPVNSRWVQIVGVYNATNWQLYENGVFIIGGSGVPHPDSPTPFEIGVCGGYGGFEGKIDDIRIYNRALSATEVNQLYRVQRGPIPVIELTGANTLQIFKGDAFTDPGALVTDDVDETRTVNGSGTVDTTTVGTYTLTYDATDTDGNNAQSVVRTVNVVLNPAGDEDSDGVTNYRELADGTDFNDPASFSRLSKGLVAYYPFDGNANDESGFNNHGAVIGAAPTNNMFDEENRAYAFQNAMVDFGNSQTLELTNDFCINIWCKLRSNDPLWTPRSPWSPFIVKRNDFASMNWQFYYTRDPSTVNFQVGPNGQYTIFQKTIEPLLEWNMLSVTRKGDLWQLFLNGQLIDNTTSSAEIQTGDSIRVAAFDADELDFYGSQDNVRLYNRALNTNEIAQLYYAEGFTLRQKQFVESHPSTAGLYSKDEYSISRTNGQTDVTTNPSAFNLFTQQEFNSNRTAGQSDVINNPMSYGLYTSNSIMDLRMNGLMLQKNGSNAVVSFQPQTTTDLTQPFTNNGTPITHEIPMPGNKGFIRIQANPGPPPTPVPTPPPYNFGL